MPTSTDDSQLNDIIQKALISKYLLIKRDIL